MRGLSVSFDGLGSFRYASIVGKTVDYSIEDVKAELFTGVCVWLTPAHEQGDLSAGYNRALVSDISLTEWQRQPTKKKPESGSNKFSPRQKNGKPGPRPDTVKGVV